MRALALVMCGTCTLVLATEPAAYVYVGEIPAVCPITIKQDIAKRSS